MYINDVQLICIIFAAVAIAVILVVGTWCCCNISSLSRTEEEIEADDDEQIDYFRNKEIDRLNKKNRKG